MKILMSIVFLSISFVAVAQSEWMSIKFSPAFVKGAQLTISKSDAGYSMSLMGDLVNESVSLQEKSLLKIKDFMPLYFIGKQKEDSLERVKQLEDEKNGIHIANLDGITIEGKCVDQKSSRLFKFWSPGKQSVNYNLMILLFNLMDGSFIKPETVRYLAVLKGYFGIKEKKVDVPPSTSMPFPKIKV